MNNFSAAIILSGCVLFFQAIQVATVQAEETVPPVEQSVVTSDEDNELEVLRRQIAALEALNERLHHRIDALEQQQTDYGQHTKLALTSWEAEDEMAAVSETEGESATTAIEEALISKGLVLIPAGRFRYTPSFGWSHNGSGSNTSDSYSVANSLAYGLPWGMSISARVPYTWRDNPNGTNNGLGDASFSLRKRLTNESQAIPSLIARINYTHDSGSDTFTPVSIGSGFRSISSSLSASKSFAPIVYYGNVSYTHVLEESVTFKPPAVIASEDSSFLFESGDIHPGDSYGLNLGASLAATPRISFDLGVSFNYMEGTRFSPDGDITYKSSSATPVYFNFATGIKLSRNLFLSLSSSAGVTDDAGDFFFSVALPYSF